MKLLSQHDIHHWSLLDHCSPLDPRAGRRAL